MELTYDPETDSLCILLRDAPVDESQEVGTDLVVDCDAGGLPVAVEILRASRVLGEKVPVVEVALGPGRKEGDRTGSDTEPPRGAAYPVIVEEDEYGGYDAVCPSLEGCRSQGETVGEALANIREAVKLCLEEIRAERRQAPAIRKLMIGIVTL